MQNKETRFYNIGGLIIKYSGPDFSEKEYLTIFRTNESDADLDFSIKLCNNITFPEKELVNANNYVYTYDGDGERNIVHLDENKKGILAKVIEENFRQFQIEYSETKMKSFGSNILMKLFDLPSKVIDLKGFFLHSSLIVWNGQGILFAGPKQVGKSTQAKLWEEYKEATIINGDRALIRKLPEGWYAFGSPYCGTSGICKNMNVPVVAVILLDKGEENELNQVKPIEAMIALLDGCSYHPWDKQEVKKISALMADFIKDTSFYKLKCRQDKSAVECLEEVLCQ